jgi:DNA-binding transcriptional ArsR family regulator
MVALVGRSRATILAQLDVPRSTTSLATRLELSAGTVSEHLAVLTQARLLTARRDGRRVLYARTQLGARLLASVHEAAAEQDVAG